MSGIDAKKSVPGSELKVAAAPGRPTIQQDAPQETYKSKKPKEGDQQRGPTLEKKRRGGNIFEVKYQKITYWR